MLDDRQKSLIKSAKKWLKYVTARIDGLGQCLRDEDASDGTGNYTADIDLLIANLKNERKIKYNSWIKDIEAGRKTKIPSIEHEPL